MRYRGQLLTALLAGALCGVASLEVHFSWRQWVRQRAAPPPVTDKRLRWVLRDARRHIVMVSSPDPHTADLLREIDLALEEAPARPQG
jgi:hypothetical protein